MMKIDSSVELKRVHAKEMLEYLRKKPNTMKKIMAEELNLSFATVSNLSNEMREMGFLKENVLGDTKVVGRTPKGISLAYENLLSLCFDMTRYKKIRACVIDYGSSLVFDESFSYQADSTIEGVMDLCLRIYEEHILKQFSRNQIIGVGVAVPGIFEKHTHHIVSSEIEMFNNQPMKAMLSEKLKQTVYIDNESNLCVMSRYMQNAAERNQENLIYIYADEGLGIGVVANGNLIRGAGGYAPEICHIPIGNPKIQCHLCGNYGCVESDLRVEGYLNKYRAYSDGTIDSLEEFLVLVGRKEETALKVMEENAGIWGKLLSILNNMFNPDCIYIGGETTEAVKVCLEPAVKEMESRMLAPREMLPKICLDENSSTTVLKGAAEMVFSQWMPI